MGWRRSASSSRRIRRASLQRAGIKGVFAEPMIYLRDLRVELERARDLRSLRVTVLDNDHLPDGEHPPLAGARVTLHGRGGAVIAESRTPETRPRRIRNAGRRLRRRADDERRAERLQLAQAASRRHLAQRKTSAKSSTATCFEVNAATEPIRHRTLVINATAKIAIVTGGTRGLGRAIALEPRAPRRDRRDELSPRRSERRENLRRGPRDRAALDPHQGRPRGRSAGARDGHRRRLRAGRPRHSDRERGRDRVQAAARNQAAQSRAHLRAERQRIRRRGPGSEQA